MPNARYTISIPSKDSDLIRYIENKRKSLGLSAYIRELIRKDMANQGNHDLEQIFLYVEKRLRESELTFTSREKEETRIIDALDKEIILDLF